MLHAPCVRKVASGRRSLDHAAHHVNSVMPALLKVLEQNTDLLACLLADVVKDVLAAVGGELTSVHLQHS